MKYFYTLFLLTISTYYAQSFDTNKQKLTGPYLGQKPPGMAPELFAPGIISLGYHEHRLAISPDGTEIYFPVFSNGFRYCTGYVPLYCCIQGQESEN